MRPTSAIVLPAAFAAALLVAAGCSEPGPFRYGSPLGEEPLRLFDESAGIHPSKAVLDDPGNPFARASSGPETKWAIESTGNAVAAYYSWATWLANQPTGEHQYYAALNLGRIWTRGLARQEDLPAGSRDGPGRLPVRLSTTSPDAASWDATGTFSFELVTAAYLGILDLGGTPSGGWLLVQDPDGNQKAVRR